MNDSNSIQQPARYKILLIGDICTDVYQYGTVERISPEAPVPVFKLDHERDREGMAGNVKRNLEALGCEVRIYHGTRSTKTRLIDLKSQQHIVRVDCDRPSDPLGFDKINAEDLAWADALVVSDYDKGYVSYELLHQLDQDIGKPVFVDTKKTNLAGLRRAYVKINNLELAALKTPCDHLIVTQGRLGAEYRGRQYPVPDVEVSDVTGAGDTFLSALTYKFLESGSMDQAIEFANRAAAVTVQRSGVYAPQLEEIS